MFTFWYLHNWLSKELSVFVQFFGSCTLKVIMHDNPLKHNLTFKLVQHSVILSTLVNLDFCQLHKWWYKPTLPWIQPYESDWSQVQEWNCNNWLPGASKDTQDKAISSWKQWEECNWYFKKYMFSLVLRKRGGDMKWTIVGKKSKIHVWTKRTWENKYEIKQEKYT